ncbi:phosphotransferase [Streptomyces sp. TRM S81-3]|uniref:Maltokinase n=1 Tax=Streptomyces griseicoloratus TaxID=2752516 RepID=A0A926L0T4_9ACTN|nr:phosphotransferase [Streptomyces griseicoloratus]MBD0420422.1 phosphotransferase [Streptomyces griseicoloratus]
MTPPTTEAAPPLPTDRLERALAAWLPWQRWYAGKGRALTGVRLVRSAPVPLPDNRQDLRGFVLVLRAEFADGGADHFQTVVALAGTVPDAAAGHVIAALDDLVVYEAVADPVLLRALFRLVAGRQRSGDLAGTSEPAPDSARFATHPVGDCRPLGVEQSNTSVVVDDRYLVKFFRRLHPGVNPDLEVQRALLAHGSGRAAPVYGAVEGSLGDAPVTLAVIQRFLPGAPDGWSVVTRALEQGATGDLLTEAHRMGRTVARVHTALADAFGTVELTPPRLAALAAEMRRQLAEARTAVPELDPLAGDLTDAFDAVAALPGGATAQRIHGDLHLGQLLRGDAGWVVIDFEGEPALPIPERTVPHSPLRDVAGMLRSFDYAADLAVRPGPAGDPAQPPPSARAQDAFCRGYAAQAGTDPRDQRPLLYACVLHKAVYETLYEARHRPALRHVPLRALARMLGRT